MAKKKRVPLNRLVTEETFESVKELAGDLECSEGEVLDQAVMLLDSKVRTNSGAHSNPDMAHSQAEYAVPVPRSARRISYAEQRKIDTEKHLREVSGKDKLAVGAGRDDIEYDPQA